MNTENKKVYTIYELPNYKQKLDEKGNAFNTKSFTGTIDDVEEELKNDKGYHIQLKKDEPCIYYGDLDHIPNKQMFINFAKILCNILKIDHDEFKYTYSFKEKNNLSFHFSIPSMHTTMDNLKSCMSKIRSLYTEFEVNDRLDLNVYTNNRWFRLPNQTNKEKTESHDICNGTFKDFICNYIPDDSTLTKYDKTLDDNDDIDYNKINETFEYKTPDNYNYDPLVKYLITDDEIINLLSKLNENHLNNYIKWNIITNVLKGLDKYKIWDNWSKQSKKYNKFKNTSIWKSNKKIKFDINYIVNIINYENNYKDDDKIKQIDSYKEYIPTDKIPHQTFNNNYVTNETIDNNFDGNIYNFETFKKYKTTVIQSCTGTGKTSAVALFTAEYIKQPKYKDIKVLSIIPRITLGDQHIISFGKKKIKLNNYQDKITFNDHLCICINSLVKFEKITNDQLSNYIVYIDEINSFLENTTHNITLDKNIRRVESILNRIIKHAHKVIVSDAIISETVFDFLKHRKEPFYIKNEYKKYVNVPAIRIRDENIFYNKIVQHVKDNQYFLFGSDTIEKPDDYYNKCIKLYPEKKDDCILITSDSKFKITDASKQFKNKFVFYSPSITYGVDFSISEKQDVFIYIKGKSINPAGSFQQTTRCRNIDNVYYYGETPNKRPQYNNLDELKNEYRLVIQQSELLDLACKILDENDDDKIIENSFFNRFCYNEYVNEIYNTNKIKHYELILEHNGFKLSSTEAIKKLNKEVVNEMKEIKEQSKDDIFNDILDNIDNIGNIEHLEKYYNKIQILQLPHNKETILKYKDVIINKYDLNEHYSIIRCFKSDNKVEDKIESSVVDGYSVINATNHHVKIKLLRLVEKQLKIKAFDLNYNVEGALDLSKNWEHIKKAFNIRSKKPETKKAFKTTYITMIKQISSANLINSKQIRNEDNIKIIQYNINVEFLQHHMNLNKYYNYERKDFGKNYKKILNIK
jgi:hypothetical protein